MTEERFKEAAAKGDLILVEDLEVGSVYKLRSRNLAFGVWTGSAFIGIRHKLGAEFLDEEYPMQSGGAFGTAVPLARVGQIEDKRILLRTHLASICEFCGVNTEFINEDRSIPLPGPFDRHLSPSPDCDWPQSVGQGNRKLERALRQFSNQPEE